MGQYGNEHANGDCRSQRICPNDRYLTRYYVRLDHRDNNHAITKSYGSFKI